MIRFTHPIILNTSGRFWILKAKTPLNMPAASRLYAHPDDADMEETVRHMEARGHTMDALKKRWQIVDPFRQ